jgi:hypothetical protein
MDNQPKGTEYILLSMRQPIIHLFQLKVLSITVCVRECKDTTNLQYYLCSNIFEIYYNITTMVCINYPETRMRHVLKFKKCDALQRPPQVLSTRVTYVYTCHIVALV